MLKKCLLLFIASFLLLGNLKAQYLPERGEWFHFSYSKLTLTNAPPELSQKWSSNGWQLMLMRETLFGRRSHWGIGYGIGFSSNFWHTNLNIKALPNSSDLQDSYLPSDSIYKANRFSASYIDIPFEFRYRSKSNNLGQYFRFYFGGLVGYRIGSYSHFKSEDYSVKYYHMNDLANLHYGVFVRTGWWLFNVYAYYGLNTVFQPNTVLPSGLDKMHNLSLGLSISL